MLQHLVQMWLSPFNSRNFWLFSPTNRSTAQQESISLDPIMREQIVFLHSNIKESSFLNTRTQINRLRQTVVNLRWSYRSEVFASSLSSTVDLWHVLFPNEHGNGKQCLNAHKPSYQSSRPTHLRHSLIMSFTWSRASASYSRLIRLHPATPLWRAICPNLCSIT